MSSQAILSLAPAEVEGLRRQFHLAFPGGGQRRAKWALGWLLGLMLFFAGLAALDFSLLRILGGLGRLGFAVSFMLPPSSGGNFPLYLRAVLETIAMAFLGTLISSLASVPLGFLGVRNVVGNRLLHFALRRAFDFVRGLDSLIWALVFVNAVGLGPLAGIMAIAVYDTGTLSKLFAEAIENVDREQIKGVRSTGASRLQTVVFGYCPQIWPVMLSNILYFFESNVRSATILGVVGAGGIGTYLADRLRILEWQQASLIIVMILIAVSLIDHISHSLRRRAIGGGSGR